MSQRRGERRTCELCVTDMRVQRLNQSLINNKQPTRERMFWCGPYQWNERSRERERELSGHRRTLD